ncbi:MAG: class I SAM-dependent rRNA methyltransferase [Bacteroidetes bacterium]|nr:MAG: class I SAM-dependent rRNA methyltransferase [Bacteroidota bacterium]
MPAYPRLHLLPGKDRSVRRRHPWIFSGALAPLPEGLTEGEVVEVYDDAGEYLATGHYQIGSIAVRILSFAKVDVAAPFWREQLERAIRWRRQLGLGSQGETNMYRLIHGEGDGLPGLIVDIYGKVAVIQCHSVGFFHVRAELASLLVELMAGDITAVYDKSAATVPYKAGLDAQDGFLLGSGDTWTGQEHGLTYQIDLAEGQKTGFFLDQRENRARLAHYARGHKVLNTFCYTGGFSIAALQGGAALVHSVDSSRPAIERTRAHVLHNFGPEAAHEAFATDAFDFLAKPPAEYDLVVLDPPAFAKHRKVLDRARKGYRRLNRAALEMLPPGGILFTFSCSQVMTRDLFREAVFTAAAQAGRRVRILEQLSQPADHPVSIYHPEGEYLKGLILGVE